MAILCNEMKLGAWLLKLTSSGGSLEEEALSSRACAEHSCQGCSCRRARCRAHFLTLQVGGMRQWQPFYFFGVEPVVVESIVRRGGPGSGRGHTLKGEMAVKTQKLERGYIYSRNLMCKVGAAKNAPTKNYITVFPRSYACLHHEQRGAWSVGSLLFT